MIVRLKGIRFLTVKFDQRRFNSMIVRLKDPFSSHLLRESFGFNSMIVRLKETPKYLGAYNIIVSIL